MPNVNFYLKKAEPSTNERLIYLKFKYGGKVLVFTFGQSIDPGPANKTDGFKNWSTKKQRVKDNRYTTKDGKFSLNDLLNNLEEECQSAYNKELKNGTPEPSTLKRHLVAFMNKNTKDPDEPTLFKLIDRFVSGEIKHKGQDKASNTIAKYKTVQGYLLDFEKKARYPVDFSTINLDFFYKFVSYLQGLGLKQNTIAKAIQVIKTFMSEAVDIGYTTNMQFKNRKFFAAWEDVDAVYLKERELTALWKHKMPSKRLEQARDLFIFGCHTGLRFSDYSSVKPENIITIENEGKDEMFIKIVTQKTKDLAIIPCHPIILQIFEKYKDSPNRLPKVPSSQKFNEYLKEACKEAELNEVGRLTTAPDLELWQCVSSHTARRTFCTLLYLQGYPNLEIMKISGHRTERSFLKYVKVGKLESARKLSKHIQLKWNEKIMKAV